MHVRSIEAVGFTSYAAAMSLELPERGVVLLVGHNGAGKSSVVEAPATAFWGKTLRGSPPWREGQPGRVTVVADVGTATRAVTKGGSKKVEWAPAGGDAAVYDTATKASEAIARVAGDFETWRRCHVFSSADAGNFTGATDAARKELLEGLLGLSCFDAAWSRCRSDLALARAEQVRTAAAVAKARADLQAADAAYAAWLEAPAEPEPATRPDRDDDPGDEALDRRLAALQGDVNRLGVDHRAAVEALREFERAARDRLRPLTDALAVARARAEACKAGECGTCGQAIAADAHDEAHDAWKNADLAVRNEEAYAAATAKRLFEAIEPALKALNTAIAARDDHTQLCRVLRVARQDREQERRAHAAWAARRAARDARSLELQRAWDAADEAVGAAEGEDARAQAELEELNCVSHVLGLSGVRAAVLTDALAGVEAVGNIYLGQIAQDPVTMRLRPYTESATGAVTEKISLELFGGPGGGHGYRGASGGERRRVDAALVLALAEMSAAAAGREPGTLFLDEILDSLDEDGIDAVAGLIAEIAADRCVVLITHSESVIQRIAHVKCVRADHGRLYAV